MHAVDVIAGSPNCRDVNLPSLHCASSSTQQGICCLAHRAHHDDWSTRKCLAEGIHCSSMWCITSNASHLSNDASTSEDLFSSSNWSTTKFHDQQLLWSCLGCAKNGWEPSDTWNPRCCLSRLGAARLNWCQIYQLGVFHQLFAMGGMRRIHQFQAKKKRLLPIADSNLVFSIFSQILHILTSQGQEWPRNQGTASELQPNIFIFACMLCLFVCDVVYTIYIASHIYIYICTDLFIYLVS